MSKHKIFLACPIGASDSPQRHRSDQLLKYVIDPVAESLGCIVTRSDKLADPGRITLQIASELGASDVVVADLTDLNANVMYELGVRQGLGRPYILAAAEGQLLPFDLLDFRTIFYKLDLDGVEDAKRQLKSQLEAALSGQGSVVNQSIFSVPSDENPPQDAQTDQRLMTVLEAVGHLSREAEETKQGMYAVANVVAQLLEEKKEARQQAEQERSQEMGMWFFSQIVQNPESVDAVMAAVQTLQNLNAPPVTPPEPTSQQPVNAPPPNRAARRRKQS